MFKPYLTLRRFLSKNKTMGVSMQKKYGSGNQELEDNINCGNDSEPRNVKDWLKEIKNNYGVDLKKVDFLKSGFSGSGSLEYTPIECSFAFLDFLKTEKYRLKRKKESSDFDSNCNSKCSDLLDKVSDWIDAVNFWIRENFEKDPKKGLEKEIESSQRRQRLLGDVRRVAVLNDSILETLPKN